MLWPINYKLKLPATSSIMADWPKSKCVSQSQFLPQSCLDCPAAFWGNNWDWDTRSFYGQPAVMPDVVSYLWPLWCFPNSPTSTIKTCLWRSWSEYCLTVFIIHSSVSSINATNNISCLEPSTFCYAFRVMTWGPCLTEPPWTLRNSTRLDLDGLLFLEYDEDDSNSKKKWKYIKNCLKRQTMKS